ncbi:MAG: hypothetical protein RLZZ28_1297 [Bacteroidota bacterium]
MKLLYTISVGLLLLTACKEKKEAPKQNDAKQATPPVPVDVIIAGLQDIHNSVEVNGTVVANEYVELHSEVSGRLTYLNVPEGSFIKQGTVIAKINDAELQAQLNKSKVALELATKNEERLRKLLAVSYVNQADYDVALNAVNGYKADIAYAQSLIDKTVIKAPFSGVMGLKQVSQGAYLAPSNIIATLQQVDKVKIDFTIPEEYSKMIQKGGTVDVLLDTRQNNKRKAVIVATEPQVTLNTRNLKVRALLQDGTANPGAFVKVMVSSGKSQQQAIMIPTNSIIPDDKNKIVIVVKNGKAAFTNVETGFRQTNNVEIIKGLKVGDTVAVTGVLFAKPKAALKIKTVKTLEQLSAN